MNNVYNVVKNGSTVPLKFGVFTQVSGTEITNTSYVDILTYAQVSCSLTSQEDLVETLATGSTVLRYDTTAGQFIFNWKTPSGTAGKCFRVTMDADYGSFLIAYLKMKCQRTGEMGEKGGNKLRRHLAAQLLHITYVIARTVETLSDGPNGAARGHVH